MKTMAAKEIKNLIVGIVIVLVGVQLLLRLSKGYTQGAQLPNIFPSIDAMSNLLTIGLVIILLFLLPFYFSKRGEEKSKRSIA